MGKGAHLLTALGYFGLGAASLYKASKAGDESNSGQVAGLGQTRRLTGESRIDAALIVASLAREAGVDTDSKRFATKVKHYDFNAIGDKAKLISGLIKAGAQHPAIIQAKNAILTVRSGAPNYKDGRGNWKIAEKDWEAETKALFNWVRAHCRYTRDPGHTDLFSAAEQTMRMNASDCLPEGTKLLTPMGFVSIDLIKTGDLIADGAGWVKVTNWWDKGVKPLLAFTLNNGSTLRCTKDHRVFVVPKLAGGRAGDPTKAIEKLARDVQVGDHLLSPEKLPCGREGLGKDLGWLLGVFLADGWISANRVCIAGKDGHPKEAQKRRVAAICETMGIKTSWSWKDITFRDEKLHALFSSCGKGAINKHLPNLDFDLETVEAILDGLTADASHSATGTMTYGTISEQLALQIRILSRMAGRRTHIRRVDEHGGLGTNPIYRITVTRIPENGRRPRRPNVGIVKGISQSIAMPTYDIETESGRFYLPEHDLIVHNCDDFAILLGALLLSSGQQIKLRIIQTNDGAKSWNHIYLLTNPAADGKKWIPLDASVAKPAGWEAPGASEALRTGKPAGMVARVKDFDV